MDHHVNAAQVDRANPLAQVSANLMFSSAFNISGRSAHRNHPVPFQPPSCDNRAAQKTACPSD